MKYMALVLSMLFGFMAVPAFAASPLPTNGVINAPGDYYLTGHRTSTGATNISITADNVRLDLRGFLVRCNAASPQTTTTFGILANNRTGIHIFNGRITGCQFGIHGAYSSNMKIADIDFTGTRYVGVHLGGSNNRIVGNTFAEIGGWAGSAYAIGINNPGNNAIIERNAFLNIYRQDGVSGIGEGVGVIISPQTPSVSVRNNIFLNEELRGQENIGVWVGVGAHAIIRRNSFTNYEWAIGAASAEVSHNTFWMQDGGGKWAIDVTEGTASNNLIVGWDVPWNGNVVDVNDNIILP